MSFDRCVSMAITIPLCRLEERDSLVNAGNETDRGGE